MSHNFGAVGINSYYGQDVSLYGTPYGTRQCVIRVIAQPNFVITFDVRYATSGVTLAQRDPQYSRYYISVPSAFDFLQHDSYSRHGETSEYFNEFDHGRIRNHMRLVLLLCGISCGSPFCGKVFCPSIYSVCHPHSCHVHGDSILKCLVNSFLCVV